MTRPPSTAFGFSMFALVLVSAVASASDWPTYRHDIARTGGTPDALNPPLALRWVYAATHPPEPAWSAPAERPREGFTLRHRVNFDDAFQLAVADGRVYFGSSADDKVYALSATTGEEFWSFYTGGPVRLVPAISRGRAFVGSDDGFVYCLDAVTGELIWRRRGGPTDERLLGNGRMISRWPIRTGVLVDDGVAYFGAGIFPHENVYLMAVRADDGEIVWRNDAISEAEAYRNDLSPQGYLLATAEKLFVPSGRALPVGFDKSTGIMLFNRQYGWRGEEAGGLIGGTYALLADNQVYTGTQEHLLTLDQNTGRAGFAWFPGRRLTVSGTMAYTATGREIQAVDRTAYARASRRRNALEYKLKSLRSQRRAAKGPQRADLEQQVKDTEAELAKHHHDETQPAIAWRTDSACDAELIVSANLVVAGGQNAVAAFDREHGDLVWSAAVEGRASGLAIAGEHLYVSTDTGNIYCFAAGREGQDESRVIRHARRGVAEPYPEDERGPLYAAAAEAIVMESGITEGYCLLLGAEAGRLALELAKRTRLHIIGTEQDPAKVRTARAALDAAGYYGERVVIDQGEPSRLPYSNYFANLIVSDRLLLTGQFPGEPQRLARHLKPCGGTICLGLPTGAPGQKKGLDAQKLAGQLDRLELGRCRISQTNGLWATLKRGPLAGAGRWTHQYAGPGNTACSDDQLLGGPLGLLWFGEPGPAPMVNRHDAAAAPLAVNGRLFVQGEHVVMAYDSYNGTELWKRDISGAMRTRLKRSECGNLAASETSLFVAVGEHCLQLDSATGQTQATFPLPSYGDDRSAKWGYLAYVDGVLYGSSLRQTGVSDAVFAIDGRTGRLLWRHAGRNIVNLTIAVGDGWIFFVDSSLTPEQRQALLQRDKSHLIDLAGEQARDAEARAKKLDARLAVALDARTGGKLWERPVDVTDCSGIGIGGGELTAMYHNGVVVLCGANANGHYWRQFLAGEFSQRRLVALSARTGRELWARDADYRHRPVIVGDTVLAEPWTFDLQTGTQKTRTHPVSGLESPWQFLRPGHHCGAISACPQTLLMRSGFTAYYDLREDSGIRHFAGQRPGCWINAIAADGLALIPEASAGCVCLFPIVCSLALEPRGDHDRWGIYSAGDPLLPVRHLAVNLGAPGDRRDSQGTLWLAYPRPGLPSDRRAMGLSLEWQVEVADGGQYVRHSTESAPGGQKDRPWLFASGVRGLQRCVLPLRRPDDGPADYIVRLYFAGPEVAEPSGRRLDIQLQGKTVMEGFNPEQHATVDGRPRCVEFADVRVTDNLDIAFVASDQTRAPAAPGPILSGLEVLRTDAVEQRQTPQVAQR